jgi:endonuclease/exonuclease/phosphatase family metal-dependent hydrolase
MNVIHQATSKTFIVGMLLLLARTGPLHAEEIRVLTWNVESDRPGPPNRFADGNTPVVIAAQLTQLQADSGPYDLIALTEVLKTSAKLYEQALEAGGRSYRSFVSQSGSTDRLQILFDEDRFTLVGSGPTELTSHEGIEFHGGSARRPFFVRLRDTQNDNMTFIFMTNHLTRGNAGNRQRQALGPREWVFDQTVPVIAAGDFNFDFDFENLTGNQAMAIFFERGHCKWIVPEATIETVGTGADERTNVTVSFVDSNWADANDHEDAVDRLDEYPGSVLDFVVAGQEARQWDAISRVIVRDGDFPDTADTSDHRPVEATFRP